MIRSLKLSGIIFSIFRRIISLKLSDLDPDPDSASLISYTYDNKLSMLHQYNIFLLAFSSNHRVVKRKLLIRDYILPMSILTPNTTSNSSWRMSKILWQSPSHSMSELYSYLLLQICTHYITPTNIAWWCCKYMFDIICEYIFPISSVPVILRLSFIIFERYF